MQVITIGRNPNNEVVINDIKVSRNHCQIIQDERGNFRMADFGSRNGTFVNGRRVSGEIYLNPTDSIRIGNTTLPWRGYFGAPVHQSAYASSPPPPPIVINNNNNIVNPYPRSRKSMGAALLLTFFFGPLGLFYASITGGVIMTILSIIVLPLTLFAGSVGVWPICMIWAAISVNDYNNGN